MPLEGCGVAPPLQQRKAPRLFWMFHELVDLTPLFGARSLGNARKNIANLSVSAFLGDNLDLHDD
jgi:hypothetical protein